MFKCNICSFSSKLKSDLNRHLKTKKHIKNKKKYEDEIENNQTSDQKVTILRPFSDQKVTILRPKSDHFLTSTENKKFFCEYCDSGFSTKTHLYRHIRQYCKVIKFEKEEKEKLQLIIKEKEEKHEREKQELRNYIDKLIEKTATTTINIDKQLNQDNSTTNSITLNNYGQEDISHITDQMKLNFIKLPFTGVQNMIEQVHFNNKKPENKNIAITNKKENMIKVYKDNRWRYKDKGEIIDELIQINYGRLDDHYEKGLDRKLSNVHNNRYKRFQNQFDNQEDKLINMIKKDVEMLILSDNL